MIYFIITLIVESIKTLIMSKIAVVTGGNRGLGRDMVLNLAKGGKDIIFTFNSKEDEANEVIKEVEALGRKAAAIQLNVERQSSFDLFFDQLSSVLNDKFDGHKIDYWVNNAGIGLPTLLGHTDEKSFDTLMNIHLKSPYFLVQSAINFMNDGGGIVNIGTGLTRFSMIGYSVYAGLKSAMETMTRYWAMELGNRKIRVNAVAPVLLKQILVAVLYGIMLKSIKILQAELLWAESVFRMTYIWWLLSFALMSQNGLMARE